MIVDHNPVHARGRARTEGGGLPLGRRRRRLLDRLTVWTREHDRATPGPGVLAHAVACAAAQLCIAPHAAPVHPRLSASHTSRVPLPAQRVRPGVQLPKTRPRRRNLRAREAGPASAYSQSGHVSRPIRRRSSSIDDVGERRRCAVQVFRARDHANARRCALSARRN